MYYIGIDISKFKHDCAVIDDSGEIVTPSWSFTNDAGPLNLQFPINYVRYGSSGWSAPTKSVKM